MEDLKDLGVAIVGHRRKLLNAIAILRAEAGDQRRYPTRLWRLIMTPKTPPSAATAA